MSTTELQKCSVPRLKDGRTEGLKDWKAREDSSSDSEDKVVQKVTPPLVKRRNDMDGGEVVEKRKKGRPRKDSKMMMSVPQVYTQVHTLFSSLFIIFSNIIFSFDS